MSASVREPLTDQQRMLLLEDRERIARDLHDDVIQRLFAAGMSLHGAARLEESDRLARIEHAVTDIDEAIAQIRTTIFGLQNDLGPCPAGARAGVLAVVDEVAPQFGFEPRLCFTGPIDSMVANDLAQELAAVVRESLTNAARHSRADFVSVSLTATTSLLVIDVIDNGVGVGTTARRSGLENLRLRAENRGGSMHVGPAPQGHNASPHREGNHLQWTIPLS